MRDNLMIDKMDFLPSLQQLNNKDIHRRYFELIVNQQHVGYIDQQIADQLPVEVFKFDSSNQQFFINFSEQEKPQVEQIITDFFRSYFKQSNLSIWRDELYPVSTRYGGLPLFLIERSILSFLGLKGYGVHINGYVLDGNECLMWIAKRSATKPTYPNKLDQIAAGGIPYGVSVSKNVIKECQEEADIPYYLSQQAKSVSALAYHYDLPIGKRRDFIFCYDLLLPTSFMPTVNDGEVASFTLMPIKEVLSLISNTDKFKLNSAAVIIDFAIRHGYITPHCNDYLKLRKALFQW